MAGRSVNPEKIIELLAELKEKTPEYPPELLEARKTAFLQQAISINFQGKGPGGESGASSGGGAGSGSGSGFFGGLSATQGILLQATVGVWIIAAMLTAAYAFRDQIIDLLQGNETVQVTEAPPALAAPVTEAPPTEAPPTEVPPTEPPSSVKIGPDGIPVETYNEPNVETLPGDSSEGQDGSNDSKDNRGLQIGKTPGAPAAPGQDDSIIPPGQDENSVPPGQVDKPEKPDNPNKPDKNK